VYAQESPIRTKAHQFLEQKLRETIAELAVPALAAVLLSSLTPITASADLPSVGSTAPGIEDEIDAIVEPLSEELKLPGISVAVTRNGKLMVSKAYGYANTTTQTPLKTDMTIRIGSVTKATVTGPAAFHLTKDIDRENKKLYGPDSMLGTNYTAEMERAIARHLPIIDTAIGPDGKVRTWHANGTVSVGDTTDLDKFAAAVPFALPPGKQPVDIRGISMSMNGKVWVWYDDGRRSVGTPTTLDAYQKLSSEATKTKVPAGKLFHHVVGIGIDKSNDHVVAWYEDGSVSRGTPLDFGAHHGPRPFLTKAAKGGSSYDIRAVDISADGKAVAWFANGTVSAGSITQLFAVTAPLAYSLAKQPANAPMPDWKSWYSQISVQDLFDHRAGFTHSGDLAGTVAMFDEPELAITYDQHHRHFLSTRKLLSSPGSSYAYSNHGFGLWTLIIEKSSGKAYYPYVRDSYLAPMSLDKQIVPELASPRCYDAWNHRMKDGKPVPYAFEQHGLGLAAGGFRSSARALTVLMKQLRGKYNDEQLDDMGWFKTAKGKLYHDGKVGGGTASVAMFPDGYVSNGGVDLSNTHVAVITNIETGTGPLADLADELAIAVAKAGVSPSYDGYEGKPVPSCQ
jgi:CubicO group peptidase (beta-lactamase class C family)